MLIVPPPDKYTGPASSLCKIEGADALLLENYFFTIELWSAMICQRIPFQIQVVV